MKDQEKHCNTCASSYYQEEKNVNGGKDMVRIDSENGTITIQAEKKVNISAGSTKIIMESGGSLSVSSDSSAKIKSSKVTVNGDNTEVKGGSSLKLSSGGQTSVKGAAVKIN